MLEDWAEQVDCGTSLVTSVSFCEGMGWVDN